MKTNLQDHYELYKAICENKLVFLFGTGISSALTGKRYSWYKWISDGISNLSNSALASALQTELDSDFSADHLVNVAGKVIEEAKADGTYATWMHQSFEIAEVTNTALAESLKKVTVFNDVFATTNYDLLLERAIGLQSISYEQPDLAISMIESGRSDSVLHLHGLYDSIHNIDSIVADRQQYDAVLDDKGAQFIQNLLSTRTLIFIGCGKTTEDINIKQFVEFARKYLKLDRPYYFLYNEKSPVTDLPDNIRLVPYGDSYADLPAFLEEMAQERIRRKILSQRIIGRTAYSEQKTDAFGLSEYHFSRENLAFCGRKYELGLLNSFLEADAMVAWWAITGQAGAGKSRLAYELIKKVGRNWFSFFLSSSATTDDVKRFEPFSDTIVIIDYVLGNESILAGIVSELIYLFLSSHPQYKLRIVFLERENLTIHGTWYYNLEQCFKLSDRSQFLSFEYHPNPSIAGHDFLNVEDLDDDAVVELIGNVCRMKGLLDDVHRDRALKLSYERKYEQLRFRPLFVQIFVQAWIENGQTDIDYRNYRELLSAVLKKETEHFQYLLNNEVGCVAALFQLLVRASISPLDTENLPEAYAELWNLIKEHIKANTIPGISRRQRTQSIIKDAAQSLDAFENIIDPQYPDLIKEALFLDYVDDYESISQELWEHCPDEYAVFLYRCLIDFPDASELSSYVIRESEDKANLSAMRARQALLHHDVITLEDDPVQLNAIADREYEYWKSVDGSIEKYREIRIDGLVSVLHNFLGWSRKEVFQIMDEIICSSGQEAMIDRKTEIILETARYFTKWASFEASEKTLSKIDKFAGLSHLILLEIQALHVINHAGVIKVRLFQGEHDREWKAIQGQLDSLGAECDLSQTQDAEIYTRTILEVLKLAQTRFAGGPGVDIFFRIQDYAENWSNGAAIAFNDEIHFNYLYSKYIHIENVAVSSTLTFGNSTYAAHVINEYIEEVSGNIMIRDFSGLLVGGYALKVGFDENVTAEEVGKFLQHAEKLLDEYPDSSLLASTYMELIDHSYRYEFNAPVPQDLVERSYALILRFPEAYEVLNSFFTLLKNSAEKNNWKSYVCVKSVVNGLIRNGLNEYLFEPIEDAEKTVVRKDPQIGRNDPCPCGSGKKFKKCCLGNG